MLLCAAREKEKAYDMIEGCFERINHFLGRVQFAGDPCRPLRNIFLLILADVLKICGIATSYVKRGGVSKFPLLSS